MVNGARRQPHSGSIYQRGQDERWVACLIVGHGLRRRRQYLYGRSRVEVEARLTRFRERGTRTTGKGFPDQARRVTIRRAIKLALETQRSRGWTDDRTAEVIAAWLSENRVAQGIIGPCVYCGEHAASEVDHDLPVARGGRSVPENLVSACKPCNRRKRDLTGDEFRALNAA